MNNKAQLNALVPEEAKDALKVASEETGVKMELLVLDAIKLLAGQTDGATRRRVRLFRDTCKRFHLHVALSKN